MSLLGAGSSDLLGALRDAGVNLLWHPSLSEATGEEALRILRSCAGGETPLDILCVEGAALRGPGGTGRFHVLSGTGEPMTAWLTRLAARAGRVVAIGTCAA